MPERWAVDAAAAVAAEGARRRTAVRAAITTEQRVGVLTVRDGRRLARDDDPSSRTELLHSGPACATRPVSGRHSTGKGGEAPPVGRGDPAGVPAAREADDSCGVAGQIVHAMAGEGLDLIEVDCLTAQQFLLVRRTRRCTARSPHRRIRRDGTARAAAPGCGPGRFPRHGPPAGCRPHEPPSCRGESVPPGYGGSR